MITAATYNVFNLSMPRTPEERRRYDGLVNVVRWIKPDSLNLQEILAVTPVEAGSLVKKFADDTDLACMTAPNPKSGEPSVPALAASQHGHLDSTGTFRGNYYVAQMWNPDVQPIPGGWRAYNGMPDFWHAMSTIRLDFGGRKIKTGAFQGDPFRPDWRYNESRRVTSAFLGQTGWLGADFNCLSADLRKVNGLEGLVRRLFHRPPYYYPEPYTRQRHDMLEYQILWRKNPRKRPIADRRAAEVMLRAGLLDPAAVLNVPLQASCGHWTSPDGKQDTWGYRNIDTSRVTRDVAQALVSHKVVDTEEAKNSSDHLPAVTVVDETRIPPQEE